jgi:hypothetical protein
MPTGTARAYRSATVSARPMVGERIVIRWDLPSDAESGPDADYATVVDTNEYSMTVRVGWIGSTPMLMMFGREVRDYAETDGALLIPMVSEAHGVAVNYHGWYKG